MGSSRVEEFLARNKRVVDECVFKVLPASHSRPEVDLLYKMMSDYPSRPSKGLRPSLCTLTCQAFGGSLEQALLTAAALELFQNWILIHDDVEDGSMFRRGEPVLHRKFGVPLSINAGDALHGRMWGLLLENERVLGREKALALAREFLYMINETTEGQHIELAWMEKGCWDLSEDDYIHMCEKKTAWYTCASPCRLGGIIAGAEKKHVDAFVPFGLNLGVAFQIQDDLLNLVGRQERYGKEVGGDILEGKRTLMLIRLLNTCTPEERGRVLRIVGKKREEKTREDVREVIGLMRERSVFEYAKRRAGELASKARRRFDSIFKDAPNQSAASLLRDLIGFMIEREW